MVGIQDLVRQTRLLEIVGDTIRVRAKEGRSNRQPGDANPGLEDDPDPGAQIF